MTARHDLDRMLDAFLTDGPTELPDPSFDTVRDRTESTRQRVVLGPWRLPDMNKLVPIGLGAAAVAVALVVGARLLGPAPAGPVGVWDVHLGIHRAPEVCAGPAPGTGQPLRLVVVHPSVPAGRGGGPLLGL